jgi:uncharacterized damage-inducible protein DinB
MSDLSPWLDRPGLGGPCGALMDLYAGAAEDFCRELERVSGDDFRRPVESPDPDTRSIRALAAHVVSAARRYADYIRQARGLPHQDRFELAAGALAAPADVRPLLAAALRYTEGALDGLYDAGEEALAAIRFEVRWGPTYDPEMLLEHAIVHLLRHRRQLERWPG